MKQKEVCEARRLTACELSCRVHIYCLSPTVIRSTKVAFDRHISSVLISQAKLSYTKGSLGWWGAKVSTVAHLKWRSSRDKAVTGPPMK